MRIKQTAIVIGILTLTVLQGYGNAEFDGSYFPKLEVATWIFISLFTLLISFTLVYIQNYSKFWLEINPYIGGCFIISAIVMITRGYYIGTLDNILGFSICAVMFGVGIMLGGILKLKKSTV